MKKHLLCALAYYGASACVSTSSADTSAQEASSWREALGADISDEWSAPIHRQFDFWIGEGEANWRAKPQGEFYHQKEGSWTRGRVFPILGGKALIELAWARDNPEEASQRGFSIRYFDPARERWVMAQNWPGPGGNGSGFMDQLIGKEYHGRLSMYSIVRRPDGEGEFNIQHRRYNFTDIRPGVGFRWDGSNTADEGATWSTWYVVDFHALRALDPYGPAGTPFPGVHGQNLCTEEPHGAFNNLQGVWQGETADASGAVSPATFSAGLALDGCGVMGVMDANDIKTFVAVGYNATGGKWMFYTLDDQPGTTHEYYVSDEAGEGAVFRHAPDLAIKDEFTAYNLQAYFEAEGALRRIVWEKFTETEIRLKVETRSAPDTAWRLEKTYRLIKQ
ncbi:hypothetical protein PUV54_03395 [Hyphococcus flavus]|uniref:DUF1579 domain-containing protein n=1 Tax=Hyphococcus flavus TaxID=1866326 RepID=A0AAE9ZGC0_9PROT|nr:hypothetical protein [Hyphococcus flavus]WDI32237.1 hypothetical protein PUV54_03395 [Hyphococcus flavus]